jgi:membrane protein involved in colicin uptake
MQALDVVKVLSLVTASQTRIMLHTLEFVSHMTLLNLSIWGGSIQRLGLEAPGEHGSTSDAAFLDEALGTLRRSWDASSVATRALATEIEDLNQRIRELVRNGEAEHSYMRHWRVKA